MPRVDITATARRDINDIWNYLDKHASERVANRVVSRIFAAMDRAARAPAAYATRKIFDGSPRRINVYRYGIFFRELGDGNGIVVWRVLHGARDLPRLVKPPKRH